MESCFLTGATGFVGHHLADALLDHCDQVYALVRPDSDARFLEERGIRVHRGDLADQALLRRLVVDADVVVHCAAQVGETGRVQEYRAVNVEGTRHVLEACKGQALSRLVFLSCLQVYTLRHHHGSHEKTAMASKLPEGYGQSKLEAERLVMRYYRDLGVPTVVLRAGYVYGPGDRRFLPGLIEQLKNETFCYLGRSEQALCTLYVGNLVHAILLATELQEAVGEVYNLTDGEYVSKRQFVEAVAMALELPLPLRSSALWSARLATWLAEMRSRLTGVPPVWTRAKLRFLGYNQDFSIEKAQQELGYWPRFTFEDGMYQTMKWYKEHLAEMEPVGRET